MEKREMGRNPRLEFTHFLFFSQVGQVRFAVLKKKRQAATTFKNPLFIHSAFLFFGVLLPCAIIWHRMMEKFRYALRCEEEEEGERESDVGEMERFLSSSFLSLSLSPSVEPRMSMQSRKTNHKHTHKATYTLYARSIPSSSFLLLLPSSQVTDTRKQKGNE